MSKLKNIEAEAISTTRKHDALQTKYFCQVTRKKSVETVMQMSAKQMMKESRSPLRYVLVIDRSGSMDSTVGNGTESLMDRVKIFAELVIENVGNRDSIAIVTFSSDVQVDMPVTVMTKEAKIVAKKVVQKVCAGGGTNLEIGLMTGLDELKRSPCGTRDMIIVFTDGLAGEGETDAEILVQNYKSAQATKRKSCCVPLSAFTIGDYPPLLLEQLAANLGSEAFYWLNENEEFEADMLLPIFMREETQVTDVKVRMECIQGVTFSAEDVSEKYLEKGATENILEYFIHAIPSTTRKHIPFTLTLPQDNLQDLDGKPILDIYITYMDGKLVKRNIKDRVELRLTTLHSIKPGSQQTKLPEIMKEISAFSVVENKVHMSWIDAQEALANIAGEKYRRLSLIAMSSMVSGQSGIDEMGGNIRDAILEINKVKKTYTTLIGEDGKHGKMASDDAREWVEMLKFGNEIKTKDAPGRLFAMKSSVSAEMPAAKGVFDPKLKRPFLPKKIEAKLGKYEKIARRTKKERMKSQPSSVFKAQNVLLSESLRNKKVEILGGARKETLSELIKRCGGRPVMNVNTVFNNTFLVCSARDFEKNTVLVRDAKRAHIPIVREKFLFDSIGKKKLLELEKYLLRPGSVPLK